MDIGFIGLGYMGHGMAKNLLEKGHTLHVRGHRNRAPVEDMVARGATEAESYAAMARDCAIVHMCLSTSDQVEAVIRGPGGILEGAREGLIVIDTTTANPVSTEALAAELAEKGAVLVDAPLGRTPKEAEAGTLDAMVGCDPDVFETVRPVIECWAGTINHVGPTGSGHKMKLIMNLISLSYAAIYAEALVLGVSAGVAPQSVRKVIGDSRLSNGFFDTFMGYAVGRDREIHKFTVANAAKDLRYAASLAAEGGMANLMGAEVRNLYAMMAAQGGAENYVVELSDFVAGLNGIDLGAEVARGED